MYDVFYLSYHEEFADDNFEKLLDKAPHAVHVRDIKGIFNAHQACALKAKTRMFYVVDADAVLVDDFEFDYEPNDNYEIWKGVPATTCVHVWRSRNPINGLEYGYGGVKLFPTQALRDAKDWHIDFTTSVAGNFVAVQTVSNITAFNTDPWNTWKSAFRECAKLSAGTIKNAHPESIKRLDIWCTKGEKKPYGEYAIAGAQAGRAYGEAHAEDTQALDKINDFDWLREQFNEYAKL